MHDGSPPHLDTHSLLDRLIAYPTVSAEPNIALITDCAELLRSTGALVEIIPDETGSKANLFATIGPTDRPGVMLSGHTDVVPTDGQNWTVPPFQPTHKDGRIYGRGATDMKGFVASALSLALRASALPLKTPLHLALSYDEEVGCLGVRSLIEMLEKAPVRPAMCIVGEPTEMGVATGHKGKTALRLTARGREAHSALAPTGLNAIHLLCDLIAALRDEQASLRATGTQDEDYDVSYTTVHTGTITGGTALNIVPNQAHALAEIRNLATDDPAPILARLRARAEAILAPHRLEHPQAALEIEVVNSYPALATPPDAQAVQFVRGLTGSNTTKKVAFGTEGGLFDTRLGIPNVICGPGSMAQGHRPDEYITYEQLARCDAMMNALLERLVRGI